MANLSSYINISANTVSASGNITSSVFSGNGSALTSLTGANVTGTVPAANVTVNAVMSLVSNNQEYRPVLATNTAGNLPFKGSAGISWNPSTYAFTAGQIKLGSGIGGQGVTGTYAYGGNVSWAIQSQNGTGVDAQGQEIGRFGSEYTSGATTFWDSYVSYYQGSGANSGYLIINAAGNAVANVTGQGIRVTGYTSATGNVTGGNILTAGLISATGNVTGGNISVTGTSNLGSNANVKITGGTSGQALTTDGLGNLSWTTTTGGNTILTRGQFWSNVTQTVAVVNTQYQFVFNNTDLNSNVVLGTGASNSRIIINQTGIYNIQFSAQIDKAGSGSSTASAYIWFKKNGATIEDSAGFITLDNVSQLVQSWNILANVTTAGDYFEIAYASSSTTFSFPTIAGNVTVGYPASPSVIVTVTPVGA